MSRRLHEVLLVAVLVVVGLLLGAGPAFAHLDLRGSEPAAGAKLLRPPDAITLSFTLAPDPAGSIVKLYGPDGRVGGLSEPVRAPGDALRVRLPAGLPKGEYTVEWRALAEDGHVAQGSFSFRLLRGAAATASPSPSPSAAASPQSSPSAAAVPDFGDDHTHPGLSVLQQLDPPEVVPRWAEVLQGVGRWLLYAGLALLLGGAAVVWWALAGERPGGTRLLLWLATLAALAGAGLMTYTQAVIIGAPRLEPLWATTAGEHLFRLLIAVGAGCGLALLVYELAPSRWAVGLAGLAAASAMLVRVLGGHADEASVPALAVALQWLHLVAIGAWVGGLVWLLLGLRGADRTARVATVARFSAMAGIGIAVVALTGAVRSLESIGAPAELLTTDYGRTLLVKVGAFLLLAALGALARWRLMPALPAADSAVVPFRASVRLEVLVGVVVLALAAALAGLAPPG
jgi:copper transport protein